MEEKEDQKRSMGGAVKERSLRSEELRNLRKPRKLAGTEAEK